MSETTQVLEDWPVRQQWRARSEKNLWPTRLQQFIGSRLIDDVDLGDTTVLIVELSPGLTADSISHLTGALASLFDLAVGAVFVEAVPEKARRIRLTIKDNPLS